MAVFEWRHFAGEIILRAVRLLVHAQANGLPSPASGLPLAASRSLATALLKGALASGSPPPELHHYSGRDPGFGSVTLSPIRDPYTEGGPSPSFRYAVFVYLCRKGKEGW
jgi:hypothetical protein